jgi:hypothetical protein
MLNRHLGSGMKWEFGSDGNLQDSNTFLVQVEVIPLLLRGPPLEIERVTDVSFGRYHSQREHSNRLGN